MSSRITSDFGSLGDRAGSGHATAREAAGPTRWVEVDDGHWRPGVLVSWSRAPAGWLALVAWVADDELRVASLPSSRVRPAK